MEEYKKSHTKIINSKYQEEFKLKNLKYQVDLTLSDIQDCFEYIIKNREILSDKSPVQIYVYKIQGSITFKIKTRCYSDVLTLESIKLLGSTERRITKDKNSENVP